MKKVFAFAAIAALTLGACNQLDDKTVIDQAQNGGEISFVALSNANRTQTKGFVEGADFVDTAFDKLRDASATGTDRTMMVSAYFTPDATQTSAQAGNYFVGQEFAKDAADNLWHHNPKVYWPMGGTLDFLAYSSTEEFAGKNVVWNQNNAASEVRLEVGDKYMKDDIIYSGALAQKSSTAITAGTNGANGMPMLFAHAQAWIEFKLAVDDATMEAANVVVKDIKVNDAYCDGVLTIKADNTVADVNAASAWDFIGYSHDGFTVKGKGLDAYSALDVNLVAKATEYKYIDFLVPAQKQTSLTLVYTLNGGEELTYDFSLENNDWLAGKKYIYEIVFKPYEIRINPSVVPFDVVDPATSSFPATLE